ncbi:MAG: hypothetical protein QXL15_03525, partial [Candidatus Korarchaeota archaeon]
MDRTTIAISLLALLNMMAGIIVIMLMIVPYNTLGTNSLFGLFDYHTFIFTDTSTAYAITLMYFLVSIIATVIGAVVIYLARKITVHSAMELLLITVPPISISLTVGGVISDVGPNVLLTILNLVTPLVLLGIAAIPIVVNFVIMKTAAYPKQEEAKGVRILFTVG